ncbi:uncharacterized protein G2W53_033878 [Senna tora]|uniref:Uncharacterized protein n=1 Tax=Senna tora TaxID=362788 RepID=A0A834W8E4_9FABA|nr:uncharacterized protein G2W53_033878 [Senna tora]
MENMAEVKVKKEGLSILVWVDLGKEKSGRVEEVVVALVDMEVWFSGGRRERENRWEREKGIWWLTVGGGKRKQRGRWKSGGTWPWLCCGWRLSMALLRRLWRHGGGSGGYGGLREGGEEERLTRWQRESQKQNKEKEKQGRKRGGYL